MSDTPIRRVKEEKEIEGEHVQLGEVQAIVVDKDRVQLDQDPVKDEVETTEVVQSDLEETVYISDMSVDTEIPTVAGAISDDYEIVEAMCANKHIYSIAKWMLRGTSVTVCHCGSSLEQVRKE